MCGHAKLPVLVLNSSTEPQCLATKAWAQRQETAHLMTPSVINHCTFCVLESIGGVNRPCVGMFRMQMDQIRLLLLLLLLLAMSVYITA